MHFSLDVQKSKKYCGDKVVGDYTSSGDWFYHIGGDCYVSSDYLVKSSPSCSSSTPSTPSPGGSCTISGMCVCQRADNFDTEYTLDCKKYGLSNASMCSQTCEGVTKYSTCKCE